MSTSEARTWRRLAIGGAASTGLLVTRILVSPQKPLYRWLHPEWKWLYPDLWRESKSWLGETIQAELYRRLSACETSIKELWAAHNDRR